LPSKYRLPLVLHYFGGLNRDEMAAELGCKPSTLGVRIFRGRAMLAGRLTGRGINFTPGMLPLALGYTIKSAVSQAMVASTSHAATAAAAGHDLIGLVSARVIGLTRKAAGAAMIGKLKFAAAILVLALTTLGAGARAFGMLPKINIGQIITDQIHKLIQPLLGPVSIPLQASAAPTNSSSAVQPQYAIAPSILPPRLPATMRPSAWSVATATTTPPAAVGVASPSLVVPLSIKSNSVLPGFTVASAVLPSAHAQTSSDKSVTPVVASDASASASSASASDSATDANSLSKSSDTPTGKPIYAAADGASSGGSGGAGGGGGAGGASSAMAMFATPAENLYLPPPSSSSAGPTVIYIPSGNGTKTILMSDSKSSLSKSSNTPVIRIPTSTGLVTESNGVLSGWGTVPGTGTLDINGNKVVADGDGVDRTLNLSTLSITDIATNTPSQTAGFYATNHGRLTLSLQPVATGGALVWGEDPSNPTLDLVNSVRLKPLPSPSSSDAQSSDPTELSLVSPDRQDLPSLSGINGQPIGIWQVDSSTDSTGEIACADLTVHYDASLAASLGADNTDVRLWAYGASTWAPAVASSADTSDDLITGVASNFDYFAVTVPEPTAAVVSEFAALPSEQVIPGDVPTVPEPVGLGLLATGALLLGRRRRR
jgi:hypothetical protein